MGCGLADRELQELFPRGIYRYRVFTPKDCLQAAARGSVGDLWGCLRWDAGRVIHRDMSISGTLVEVLRRRLTGLMRFRNSEETVYRVTSTERVRVLFVCLGNACRSQMAEGFGRAWHADILLAESAGVSPLGIVPAETAAAMAEKDVSLEGQHSKGLDAFDLRSFDMIVNMSGFPFPPSLGKVVKVVEWDVEDPFSGNERRYRKVRDDIERRVRVLADELRRKGMGG